MKFQIRPVRKTLENSKNFWGTAIAFALVVISGAASARGENRLDADLFSEIRMSDTVEADQTKAKSEGASTAILGPVSLSRTLDDERVPNEIVERSVRVRLTDLLPGRTETPGGIEPAFEFLKMMVDADAERIDLVLPVRTIDSSSAFNGAAMMTLLKTVSKESNLHLTANESSLALHSSLHNQGVTVEELRASVKRQLAVAMRIESQLNAITATTEAVNPAVRTARQAPSTQTRGSTNVSASTTPHTKASTQTPVPSSPQTASKSVNGPSLLGTWSARTSDSHAWAIRFEGGGRFLMVHTTGGKNSVSKGQFKLQSDRLSLGETGGVSLSGTISWQSSQSFNWDLQDKTGKTLATLAFKKQ